MSHYMYIHFCWYSVFVFSSSVRNKVTQLPDFTRHLALDQKWNAGYSTTNPQNSKTRRMPKVSCGFPNAHINLTKPRSTLNAIQTFKIQESASCLLIIFLHSLTNYIPKKISNDNGLTIFIRVILAKVRCMYICIDQFIHSINTIEFI